MTKHDQITPRAYSRAARRRQKKGGKRAMQQNWQEAEQVNMVTIEIDNPTDTVREARKRHMPRANRSTLLDPIMCEQAGQAITLAADGDEAAKLWEVFTAYDRAHGTYSRLVLGRSRFPSISKMEFMPERLETRADDRPDLRTEDERVRDARNAMAAWDAHMAKLRPWERHIIAGVVRQAETLHDLGVLTVAGRSFVAAVRRLRDVVEG